MCSVWKRIGRAFDSKAQRAMLMGAAAFGVMSSLYALGMSVLCVLYVGSWVMLVLWAAIMAVCGPLLAKLFVLAWGMAKTVP